MSGKAADLQGIEDMFQSAIARVEDYRNDPINGEYLYTRESKSLRTWRMRWVAALTRKGSFTKEELRGAWSRATERAKSTTVAA